MKNTKSIEEIEEIFPGFKEKYNQALKNGKITQEGAQMIADANVMDKRAIEMQKTKKEFQERIKNGTLSQNDIDTLVDTIYGKTNDLKPSKEEGNLSPKEQKEYLYKKLEESLQEDPEHKEFREELQQYVYTPEQAAKNTAVREQKEIQEQQKQAPTQEEQAIDADQPII